MQTNFLPPKRFKWPTFLHPDLPGVLASIVPARQNFLSTAILAQFHLAFKNQPGKGIAQKSFRHIQNSFPPDKSDQK